MPRPKPIRVAGAARRPLSPSRTPKEPCPPSVQAALDAAAWLRERVDELRFAPPVVHVYNPLDYAWSGHAAYYRRYAAGPKRVLLLGMNPGPFGMVQTGVPFGEVASVRDWLGIQTLVGRPAQEHPKRPIQGFACPRSEVSGRRLWGLFAERFQTAAAFFRDHFVANYCPLAFMTGKGANLTPDKLPADTRQELFRHCDEHLRRVVVALGPEWIVGVGAFAAHRAREALAGARVQIGQILHPSPASPAANRDWAGTATRQMRALGLWP